MTLPVSPNTITAADINVELGREATDPFDINGVDERALAGVASGPISFSDFHGKSASVLPLFNDTDFSAYGGSWDSDTIYTMPENTYESSWVEPFNGIYTTSGLGIAQPGDILKLSGTCSPDSFANMRFRAETSASEFINDVYLQASGGEWYAFIDLYNSSGKFDKLAMYKSFGTSSTIKLDLIEVIDRSARVDLDSGALAVGSDNVDPYKSAGFCYNYSSANRYFGTGMHTSIQGIETSGFWVSDDGYFTIVMNHNSFGSIPQDFFTSVDVEGIGILHTVDAIYTASLGTTGYDTTEFKWNTGIDISTAGWLDGTEVYVNYKGIVNREPY